MVNIDIFEEEHALESWYDEEGVEACHTCGVGWPCEATKMRYERDAAIRRAADISEAARNYLRLSKTFEGHVAADAEAKLHVALRSQESLTERYTRPLYQPWDGEQSGISEPPETEKSYFG